LLADDYTDVCAHASGAGLGGFQISSDLALSFKLDNTLINTSTFCGLKKTGDAS
jgi:hypothetical protein